MKKIIALLVSLALLGGIMMPTNAVPQTIILKGLPGIEIYVNDEKIGEINESGTYDLTLTKPVNLSFRKEGYTPLIAPEGVTDLDFNLSVEGRFTYYIPLHPIPTPEPTPTPTPEGFKTHNQRIEELENQTAEQEERLSMLEKLIQEIKAFLETIGFKSDD